MQTECDEEQHYPRVIGVYTLRLRFCQCCARAASNAYVSELWFEPALRVVMFLACAAFSAYVKPMH